VLKASAKKSQKIIVTKFVTGKSIFRALCSQTSFLGAFSKAPHGFPFWTFIFVHFQKPKVPLNSLFCRSTDFL